MDVILHRAPGPRSEGDGVLGQPYSAPPGVRYAAIRASEAVVEGSLRWSSVWLATGKDQGGLLRSAKADAAPRWEQVLADSYEG